MSRSSLADGSNYGFDLALSANTGWRIEDSLLVAHTIGIAV
jgi:hypothetical protein